MAVMGCLRTPIGTNCADCQFARVDRCIPYKMATTLYNAGYRKIPENAVVLETSVYESLEIKNYRDVITERVRRETAEKFAEMLKERAFDEYAPSGECFECVAVSDIDEICKELGGE